VGVTVGYQQKLMNEVEGHVAERAAVLLRQLAALHHARRVAVQRRVTHAEDLLSHLRLRRGEGVEQRSQPLSSGYVSP